MRILVSSDLHCEVSGTEPIRRMLAGMLREDPDAIVLAGDLGNPPSVWNECLRLFSECPVPVAVIAGNHDFWCTASEPSEAMLRRTLPRMTREQGLHWLEETPLRLPGGFAVAGTVGWYDYSAADPSLGQTREEILRTKPRYAADAFRIDWPLTDEELAAECRDRLCSQLRSLEADPEVTDVLVVTHVPVFEPQMTRKPGNREWNAGAPFFGHMTLGHMVAGFSKVTVVISGHTHIEQHGRIAREGMREILTSVVSSDYGKPRWLTVNLP